MPVCWGQDGAESNHGVSSDKLEKMEFQCLFYLVAFVGLNPERN